jgi:ketosteroid isomerase-like protein
MSRENLEKLRRGQEGFSRGDLSAAKQVVAEDVDWGTTGTFPGIKAAYRGWEGMERWMEAVRSAWAWFEVSLGEVVRDTGDVLVVVERLRGQGRESGAEVEMKAFSVYWFEHGKIIRRRAFTEKAEALKAAELLG